MSFLFVTDRILSAILTCTNVLISYLSIDTTDYFHLNIASNNGQETIVADPHLKKKIGKVIISVYVEKQIKGCTIVAAPYKSIT